MAESLRGVATRVVRQTLRELLSDDAQGAGVLQAAAQLQKAHRAMVQAQEGLLHGLGFATLSDYQALTRQVARLKRRARHLRDELERHSLCAVASKEQLEEFDSDADASLSGSNRNFQSGVGNGNFQK